MYSMKEVQYSPSKMKYNSPLPVFSVHQINSIMRLKEYLLDLLQI